MEQNSKLLLILIFIAFLVRVFVIWIGRPEFVGWFNHTYYYYVQTKGLLENGALPFPDMPLLFYIYASTAKVLTWFGVENHVAIVSATRVWMCLIPSLLPIPVYAIITSIFKEQTLPNWMWVFVFASAFYPLSILYMPEFLQKNALGLLLLAIFMQQSKSALDNLNVKRFFIIFLVFILMVLSHFGSTATALLYTASLMLSLLIHTRKRLSLNLYFGLFIGLGIALFTFYLLDIKRFERVGFYINRIFDSSSLGMVFSANDPDKFASLFILIFPLGVIAIFYYWYRNTKTNPDEENSIFWISNILFCYLLVFPIYELLLMARFANYICLPIIFVLLFMIQYTISKPWVKKSVIGLVLFGTILIAVGDISNLTRNRESNDETYLDLMKMKSAVGFNNNDLIITRNGAEHISNWFLGSKSCSITSFNNNDLQKYERVFILNPTEESMSLPGNSNEATKRYNYMLSDIVIPSDANQTYKSEYINLYQIPDLPKEWKFDDKGNWYGYEK